MAVHALRGDREVSAAEVTVLNPAGIDLYEQWEAEFRPVLGGTLRWEGFRYLMRDQLERERPCILEMGALRSIGNWKGDGQSTRLWEWLAERKKAFVASVDLDVRAVELVRMECPHVHGACQDSVVFLRSFLPVVPTLLYLDSMEYDYREPRDVNCWMNQVAELGAIWGKLPSGCLIASDDNQSKEVGKCVLTRTLFERLGIQPVLDTYMVVWKKP